MLHWVTFLSGIRPLNHMKNSISQVACAGGI